MAKEFYGVVWEFADPTESKFQVYKDSQLVAFCDFLLKLHIMHTGVYSARFPRDPPWGKRQGLGWIWGRILGHFVSILTTERLFRTKYETCPPYLEHFGQKQRI